MNKNMISIGYSLGFLTMLFNLWFPTGDLSIKIIGSIFMMSAIIVFNYELFKKKSRREDEKQRKEN